MFCFLAKWKQALLYALRCALLFEFPMASNVSPSTSIVNFTLPYSTLTSSSSLILFAFISCSTVIGERGQFVLNFSSKN